MERAIKDLCQLPDAKLFEEVATGIRHVVAVVGRLDAATRHLSEAGDHHAARILGNLAEEEAAKVLVLLDAVRCPRSRQTERSRVLGYFYDHLAKGLYAAVCDWRPIDFAEVARSIDQLRVQHYLDGPNDVDWIFPNQIIQRREDDLYVGYVRDDSEMAGHGGRFWTCPDNEAWLPYWAPQVIGVARALDQVGATTPAGLAIVAEVWRPVQVLPETRFDELNRLNRQVLEVLEERSQLAASPDDIYAVIRDRWPFPLWPLDLRFKQVDRETLREARRRWTPEGW